MAKSSSGAEAGAFQRPEYTRSLLPEPSSFFNSEIIIIEPDGSRAVWYSDGTRWLPGGGTGASNFDQLTGDPLDNPALFGYLDGETGYCSGNNTISAAILAHVTKLRVFSGADGPVTFAADCASNGRVMLMVAENGQPDFTVAFGPGVTVIQPYGTTLSSADSADRSVSWICQVSGIVRVLSARSYESMSVGEVLPYVPMSATGTAITGPCEYGGYVGVTTGGNITIYDGTSAAGQLLVPALPIVAGPQLLPVRLALNTGLHVVFSAGGSVNLAAG